MPTKKTAQEHIQDIILHPTLDEVLRRDPHSQPLNPQEFRTFIEGQRRDRAAFIQAKEKRREKKQGVEETTE